jgi:hypothetical protein
MNKKTYLQCKVVIAFSKNSSMTSNIRPYHNNYYKVVNKVVELGGYIPLNKGKLDNEYGWMARVIMVFLPEESIKELSSLDAVQSCSPILVRY